MSFKNISNNFDYLRNSSRSTWKLINTILGKSKKSSTNISMQFGDSHITNKSDVSKLSNTYFSQVGFELQQKNPQSGNPLSYFDANSWQSNPFRFFDSSAAETEMLLSNFTSKGAPLDKIPVTTYKKIKYILSPVISELLILTIREGIFRHAWKLGGSYPFSSQVKKMNWKNIDQSQHYLF